MYKVWALPILLLLPTSLNSNFPIPTTFFNTKLNFDNIFLHWTEKNHAKHFKITYTVPFLIPHSPYPNHTATPLKIFWSWDLNWIWNAFHASLTFWKGNQDNTSAPKGKILQKNPGTLKVLRQFHTFNICLPPIIG